MLEEGFRLDEVQLVVDVVFYGQQRKVPLIRLAGYTARQSDVKRPCEQFNAEYVDNFVRSGSRKPNRTQ